VVTLHGKKKVIQVNEWLRRIYHHHWCELAVRWLLGAAFIFASYHKIIAPESFLEAIYSYDLFPDASVNLIAIILPYFELFSGLALIFGLYYRGASVLIGGMLFTFIIVLSINLFRGHLFDCGCFYVSENGVHKSVELMLLRDVILLCFALYVLFFRGTRKWCIQKNE